MKRHRRLILIVLVVAFAIANFISTTPTALAQEDAAARMLLLNTADDLAFGLSHAVHLFHPQIIVLGGGLSKIGTPLRAAVADALQKFVMEAFIPGPRIELTQLDEDAVPVGSLILAAQVLLGNKT